jgi:hypothetical protein
VHTAWSVGLLMSHLQSLTGQDTGDEAKDEDTLHAAPDYIFHSLQLEFDLRIRPENNAPSSLAGFRELHSLTTKRHYLAFTESCSSITVALTYIECKRTWMDSSFRC